MTNILLEKKGLIAVATINRPKALNALNSEVLTDLDELVSTVKADADIRALVITGSGEKAFVAGADIGEMSTLTKEGGEAFGKHGNNVFRAIETLPIPTIAAVNGFALGGGCELSMSCDIRICADTAVFGQPEAGLGITPGFGGTQRLARLVSPGMAKQLIYTAKNIKADEAYRIGLVNAVYPMDELLPAAEKLAETIAKNAPDAYAPLGGPISPLEDGYEDLSGLYPYNLEQGQRMRTYFGVNYIAPIDILVPKEYESIGNDVKTAIENLNINTNLEVLDSAADVTERMNAGTYNIALTTMSDEGDASVFDNGQSVFHFENGDAQQAYANAMAATNDNDYQARMRDYARAVSENAASDWLYTRKNFLAVSDGLQGYPKNLTDRLLPLNRLTLH